jgi:hypothetical protein
MDQCESKMIEYSIDSKTIDTDSIYNTINISLIKTKLQIIYTYSTKINKDFKQLLTECAQWDKDCAYALEHTSICNLYKYL